MGVNGIVPSRKELIGDVPELLFALVDRFDKERRRACLRRSSRQPPQLSFELLFPLTHLS